MKAKSGQHFENLLKILEDLIVSGTGFLRSEPSKKRSVHDFSTVKLFDLDFISESVGIKLTKEEEFICLLALVPYLNPGFFDRVISGIFPNGAELPEIGGVKGSSHRGFIPTAETALFLLAGNNLPRRLEVMHCFEHESALSKYHILQLEAVNHGEPYLAGKLIPTQETLEKVLFGNIHLSKPGLDFPAKYITTQLEWENLIINVSTRSEIDTIKNWLAHNETMSREWNLQDKFKVGYKALFFGPPGTGKTFTATLLGKHFSKDVYRIDLSQVVSKYIGETEKNLEKIFQKAENKNWILFFDEADALFGKRTSVSSAHDRYANQETSYLLQRIEDFSGLVILASNNKTNIDSAFLRRFNAIVHFPMPDPAERLHLWKIYLPSNHTLSADDLKEIAARYEVTGATILNAVHHSAINAFEKNRFINKDDIVESLKREFRKEDRMPV
jgi:hypothetical protein